MKNRPALSFLFILITVVLLSACAQPAPEPTPVPTLEPSPPPPATAVRVESDYYSYADGTWTKYYEDELTFPFMLPEDMEEGSSQEYQLIQRGYFASYDEGTQVLTMRSLVILARIFRDVQFQMDENITVSCLPASIDGTPIEDIHFMYSEKGVGFPPGAGNARFSDLLPALTTDTYMVLILTDPVDPAAINQISQIAAVCPE